MDASSETASRAGRAPQWLVMLARLLLIFVLLYCFLVAIELMGGSFKSVGKESANSLVAGLSNPFAGLAAGVLATVIVQSSSVTTSTIVALVGQGALPLSVAVPMVMGANIGTTITNTIVSLGHVTRKSEFRMAFAGATVHDFFNLLTVLILFPVELATGVLERIAMRLSDMIPAGVGGSFNSPVKSAVKFLSHRIESGLEGLGLEGGWLALASLLLALVMIVFTLLWITKNMKQLMANRIEEWLNAVLDRSGLLGLVIGILITVSVQSSSITTSLLVPMFGAGLLRVEAGFPIMLGANIGTTVTALLAASVSGRAGMTIALVHLMFNLFGTLIFFPIKPMRKIPIALSYYLADLAVTNRLWVAAYIGVMFVALPGLGVWLFRVIGQ
ncbi:MAG: Na/Pi symporter [Pirellulaceae bacterium]